MNQGAVTTVWDWLAQLNGSNFAGHNDWRLPSEGGHNASATGPDELDTIVDPSAPGCGTTGPCIDAIFGPTVPAGYYWSASTVTGDGGNARFVYFATGQVFFGAKAGKNVARAVR